MFGNRWKITACIGVLAVAASIFAITHADAISAADCHAIEWAAGTLRGSDGAGSCNDVQTTGHSLNVNVTGGGAGGGAATVADGADVAEGAKADTAWTSGSGSVVAILKGIYTQLVSLVSAVTSSIPAGTNLIGKVGIDQTTPGTTDHVSAAQVGAWTAQPISGTSGGITPFTLTAANSTNCQNVKASAGTLYHIGVYNNSATLAWVSFYNTAGSPTGGTGIVYQTMIPANSTSGAGAVEDFATGMAFGTGIGICVTTGVAGTGAVAASSYVVGLGYK